MEFFCEFQWVFRAADMHSELRLPLAPNAINLVV